MKVYNKHLRSFLTIKSGQKLCPVCKGKGIIVVKKIKLVCSKCLGDGILDWVEMATKKRGSSN